MYEYRHAHTHAHTHTPTHTHTRACMQAGMIHSTHIRQRILAYIRTYIQAFIHLHTHIHTHIHTHTYTHTHTYIHTHIQTTVHTYHAACPTHTYFLHTYTHTYRHMYANLSFCLHTGPSSYLAGCLLRSLFLCICAHFIGLEDVHLLHCLPFLLHVCHYLFWPCFADASASMPFPEMSIHFDLSRPSQKLVGVVPSVHCIRLWWRTSKKPSPSACNCLGIRTVRVVGLGISLGRLDRAALCIHHRE